MGVRYTEDNKDVVSEQFLADDITGLGTRSDNFYMYQIQAENFNNYLYDYNQNRKHGSVDSLR